jgi:hypothetical protein
MDRRVADGPRLVRPSLGKGALSWGFAVERVTGIEPALSAWEVERLRLNGRLTCRSGWTGVAVADPW